MSQINVDNIKNRLGSGAPSFPNGIDVSAGVTTFTNGLNVGTGASVFSPTTNELALGTNSAERVRVDSSGNVGIGTDNPTAELEVQGATIPEVMVRNTTTSSFSSFHLAEVGDSSGTFVVNRLGSTSTATGGARAGQIWNSANAPIVFATNNSERMRIESAGDVNTTEDLQIGTQASHTKELRFADSTRVDASSILVDNSNNSDLKITNDRSGASIVLSTDSAERVRVGSGGSITFLPTNVNLYNIRQFGFGQGRTPESSANSNSTTLSDQKCSTLLYGSLQNTNNEGAHSILLLYDGGGAAVTPGDMIKAYRSTSLRFIVRNDGDCENVNNSYTGISDQRLKQDITDAGSAWDDIKSIRVRKFRFIEEVERHAEHPHLGEAPYLLGVVAQELETVSPGLVRQNKLDNGSPDPDAMKSVKYSILYMKAVKALQEAQTRIETLETTVTTLSDRITALESQ